MTAVDLVLQLPAASLTIITGKSSNKFIQYGSVVVCTLSAAFCFVAGVIFKQIPFHIFTFLALSLFIRGFINILAIIIIIRAFTNKSFPFCFCRSSTDSVDSDQVIRRKKPSFFKKNLLIKLFLSSQDTSTRYSEIL